jgi:S1-C subfamily serine protease
MKRTVLLCVCAAVAGGMLSAVLISPPHLSSDSVAQEPSGGLRLRLPAPPPVGAPSVSSSPVSPGSPPLAPGTFAAPRVSTDDLTPEERVDVEVYKKVNRSVVNIDTESVRTNALFLFDVPTEGAGSGVVLDKQGRVLTNYHVVEDARVIRVTLFDGKSYDATPVGADPPNDVAVLRIDAPPETLYPVEFGNSANLQVGQRALAIGNPFGLDRTLSVGVIASVNRPLSDRPGAFRQLIQIDADINPGNSGGPLLDSHGRMIGMNTVIASKTGQSAGVGFAIPINAIARVVPDLVERGRVVRPDVGIASVYQSDEGLLIAKLIPNGAAERAGLRGPRLVVKERRQGPFVSRYEYYDRSAADLIVAVDGQRVRTGDELLAVIEDKRPGDRITVTVLRDGQRVDVRVTLEESK